MHPSILGLGLLAAGVPVLIHLLLRRRKPPMAWGAMRFVLQAYRRTRRRSVERWLLLAARVLLLVLAGVVLARPVVGRGGGGVAAGGSRVLWIVLDDSITSRAMVSGSAELAGLIQGAQRAVDAMAPGDRVGVVLASRPARALVAPASADLAGVRSALSRVQATDASADWAGALGVVNTELAGEPGVRGSVLLSSAWRAGSLVEVGSLSALPAGTVVEATPPSEARAANTWIEAVRAARPVLLAGQGDAGQTVTIDLGRDDGGEEAQVPVRVRLAGDGSVIGSGSVRWGRGERRGSATVGVSIPSAGAGGALSGVLVAEIDADAIGEDNRFALPLLQRDGLRVGLIQGPSATSSGARLRGGQWAELALRPSEGSPMEVVMIEPSGVDVSGLSGLDALWVLSPDAVDAGGWGRIAKWNLGGGLLIVSPPAGVSSHMWADVMNVALGLNWALPRSAQEYPSGGPGRIGAGLGPASGVMPPGDLLSGIRGEMEELARPVGVFAMLAPDLSPPPNGEASHGARVLLATVDGGALVTALRGRGGGGLLVYMSIPPDTGWSDLVAKPLMLPMVQELVRQGVGVSRPGLLGRAGVALSLPGGSSELRQLVGVLGTEGFGEGAGVRSVVGQGAGVVRESGVWRVLDGAGAERGVLAINAPGGGDTSLLTRGAVEGAFSRALPVGGAIGWGGGAVGGQGDGEGVAIGAGAGWLWVVLGVLVLEVLLGWMTARAVRGVG
ncbi:MAG: BatA domain-containing protein [bacterium]